MDKNWLLGRRAYYSERLKHIEDDIATYSDVSFRMQTSTGGGPWVDDTPQMLKLCLYAKKTHDDIIADIDARLSELEAG